MMQRIFNGKLTAIDDLTIKYKDEDGDLITVFDSQDLSFALQTSRVLKLQVFMNNLNNQALLKPKLNVEELKKQIREIRNSVTWLLDTIEDTNEGNNMSNTIQQDQLPPSITSAEVLADNGVTKEFDPLRNSKEERSKTPQTTQQLKSELSQENLAASPQPLRQTPPVQQAQISQHVYNGQSQGTLNQQIPYPGGQIPQGAQGKWVNPYPQPAMRASYPAQYSYLYSTQIPASGYSQITAQMKPTGNATVHSIYYPTNSTPNQQYSATQYQGQ
ncbi:Hypothetical protein CINCED_3A025713 [Cinara cedri]|nr:Hypothetical protein CINCED_3A025713 [Cinara cedri]